MLTSFNFLFILFSKKKLSLFDLMSKSRVVINKKIIPITEEKIIFKPKVIFIVNIFILVTYNYS